MKHTDIPKVSKRKPYIHTSGNKSDFYLESDNEFIEDNYEAAVWFLEHASELKKIVKMFNEANVT